MLYHQIVKKSKAKTITYKESIYFPIIKANTYASSILLKRDYFDQDETNPKSKAYRIKMMKFSRVFLTKHLKRYKRLYCTYCGKSYLRVEHKGMKIPHEKIATIDHIIAKSKGGDLTDPKNITICCGKCNTEKSDMSILTFLGYKDED